MSNNSINSRKIYDLDAAFDKRIGEYIKKNKGKFTEEEWEDKIPELYRKFSETKIESLGCTPNEYYARMSVEELASELQAHFEQDVEIDGFLRAAAEEPQNKSVVLALLDSEREEEVLFGMQVLGADELAVDKYVDKLCSTNLVSEKILGEIIEIITENDLADGLSERLLGAYPTSAHKECIENILSRVNKPTDEVYTLLISALCTSDEPGRVAELLAQYGDYRALDVLCERAQSEDCGYADWRSIKYAVESMGGTLPARDFTVDKDFIQYTNEEARLHTEREEGK